MQATFMLREKSGERLGEDALRADPARAAALLNDPGEGLLFIEDTQTGARAGLGDIFGVLIERFCLGGLARLQDEGGLEMDFVDHEEHLAISIAGEQVQFDSSRIGQVTFAKDDYVAALTACGQRYQALLDLLPAPEASEMIADADRGGSGFAAVDAPA